MSRAKTFVVAAALAAGLVAPVTLTSGAAVAAPAAAPKKITRVVSYGDKAVTVRKKQKAVIRFRGHRGDMVTLSGLHPSEVHLFARGSRVPTTWDGSGLFELPHTGTYAFRVGADRYGTRRVGLVKARLRRVETDGTARRTPRERRGYLDLAVLRLSPGDRLTVDTGRYEQRVYLPNGDYCVGYGGPLLLRTGHQVRVANDNEAVCDERARRGKTLVRVVSGRHRVTAAPAVEVAATPDGEPVRIQADHRAERELVVTFDGTAGDLVYVDVVDGSAITNGRSVLDRWQRPVDSLITRDSDSFVVASTGPTEVSTVTDAVGGDTITTFRLRKAIRVADVVPDGPAVDLTFDGSDERYYTLVPESGYFRLETVSSTVPAGRAWELEMGPRDPTSCGQEPGGPLGCADNGHLVISDSVATSIGGVVGPVAMATPAPGTTGTVRLRLVTIPS